MVFIIDEIKKDKNEQSAILYTTHFYTICICTITLNKNETSIRMIHTWSE